MTFEVPDLWGKAMKVGLKIDTATQDICNACVAIFLTGGVPVMPLAQELTAG